MKIVIVDDEYFVRMGIASVAEKIPGIEVVGEAENGEVALEVILKKQPDLVFLDITMPLKDGLTVLSELRKKGFTNRIILLTSHDDFDFSRKALRLGADDYVLKNELIGNKMLNYLKSLQDERQTKAIVPTQENLYKERFLQTFLRNGGINEEKFKQARQEYHLKITTSKFYIIIIEMADVGQLLQSYSEGTLQNYFQKIKIITEQYFKAPFEYESFYNRQSQFALLVANPRESSALEAEKQLQEVLGTYINDLEKLLEVEIKTAVFRNTYPMEEVNLAYAKAHKLLVQQFFEPEKKFFWEGIMHHYLSADMMDLSKMLSERKQLHRQLTDTLKDFLQKNQGALIDEKTFFSLVIPTIRELTEEQLYQQIKPEDFIDINSLLSLISDIEAKQEPFGETSSYSHLIKQALMIIQKEFRNRITLDEVSKSLEVSTSYFSRLFSSEVGQQFLTQKRIAYAQELLTTTNLKLYEISELSGFSSPVYFNNSFKKICGLTPNQYRNQH